MQSARILSLRNLAVVLEAGLLLVLPLVFSRNFVEQFSYPKAYLAQVVVVVGLAAWALGLIWGRVPSPRHFRLLLPLALLAAAVVLSSANSPVRGFSLNEAVYFLCGPAWALLLVSLDNTESTVPRLALLSAVGGSVVAAIVLAQWSGHDPLLFGGYQIDWGTMVARMRLYGTLGNPNFVAGYLIGTVFLAMALGMLTPKLWTKALWFAASGAMLAATIGTGSRGAWLSLAAGMLLFTWVGKRGPNPLPAARQPTGAAGENGRGRNLAGLVTPPVMLLAAWSSRSLLQTLMGRLAGRTYLWRFSWPMFAEHPFLGSGWGTYQLRYLELQASFLLTHPSEVAHWTNNRMLHNDPLQLLLETGLLGLASGLWVLWAYGREVRSALRAGGLGSRRLWLAASAGGVTAILLDSCFNFQFAIPPTYLLLFTLLVFPVLREARGAFRAQPHSRVEGLSDTSGDGPPRVAPLTGAGAPTVSPARTVMRLLSSLAVLVLAGALVFQRTRLAWAERDYHAALLLERREGPGQAVAAYRHGILLSPGNGRLHFGLARVLYATEQYPAALAEALLAEQTYADSHLEVLKARIQDQMGLAGPALATYRHALALDPTLKTVQADIERLSKPPAPESTKP